MQVNGGYIMLSNQQLKDLDWILSKMSITWIQEVKQPEKGFNGYLLRCKSEREEDCSNSILLFEPNGKKEGVKVYKPLPVNRDDRIAIRKNWYPKCLNEKFVGVSFDVSEHMTHEEYEYLEKVFPTDGEMLDEIISQIMMFAKKSLPSYVPFAMVLHNKQFRRNNDYVSMRPPHIHFMLRQVAKRRTSEEVKLIEPSGY